MQIPPALKTHHTYCSMNIISMEAADIRDSLPRHLVTMPYVPRVSVSPAHLAEVTQFH